MKSKIISLRTLEFKLDDLIEDCRNEAAYCVTDYLLKNSRIKGFDEGIDSDAIYLRIHRCIADETCKFLNKLESQVG